MSVIKNATAVTIGCRLNQADTALIFSYLDKIGFNILPIKTKEEISLVIINSCSVTASASQKSRSAARSWKTKFPNCFVIVTGCSVDAEKSQWDSESCVDLILPNLQKGDVEKFLQSSHEFKSRFLSDIELVSDVNKIDNPKIFTMPNLSGFYPFKSRANLKVQEGCDNYCTYCIVPYGRGEPRSRDFEDTMREFKELVARGHKEIVVTGVNITMYDCNGMDFSDLLAELIKVPGDYRIRLSSTEPNFKDTKLIDVMKSSDKVCRFLHLPLQSGCDVTLKRMGRHYKAEEFKKFVDYAVKEIPDLCIGSDVIVGFAGEEDEHFAETKRFISSLPISFLHIFRYSKREGTPAADYKDHVPNIKAKRRHEELSLLNKELSDRFIDTQVGKELVALFEQKNKDGQYVGWTDNYIKVVSEEEVPLNELVKVKLESIIDTRAAKCLLV